MIALGEISRKDLRKIYEQIVDALENKVEVEGKKIPLKLSAGVVYIEPYMTEPNMIRSRLTYAVNHSRYDHHGELVILTMRWAEETISINLSLLGLFINAQRVILTALSYFISRLQTQEMEISAAWKLL